MRRPPHMKSAEEKLKKIARLVDSLDDELNVLESAHRIQFETKASLQDKLSAASRTRSALTKARRLRDLIAKTLIEPSE
jgi:hypothetical protein